MKLHVVIFKRATGMTMQEIFLWLDSTTTTDTASIILKIMKNAANLACTLVCYCMLRKHDPVNSGALEMYPGSQSLESIILENLSSNLPANQPPPPAYHDLHARIETPPPGQVTHTVFFTLQRHQSSLHIFYLNERRLSSPPNELKFSKS